MSLRFFEFYNWWILLLAIPALLLVHWPGRRKAQAAAIVFPTVARLKGLRPTLRQRLRWTVPALETVAILALVAAAARPRQGDARTVIRSQGIAIQMVLDRSGSMEEEIRYGGKMRKKIDIVKDVFVRFLQGDSRLAGRKTDLVGLTTFARYPEESCPLVTIHEPLVTTVANLTTVAPALDKYDQIVREIPRDPARQRQMGLKENPLNKTAIGEAIRYAAASIVTAEEEFGRGEKEGGYKIKRKVIILLTDGKNNAGIDPVEAGKYAAANGIRIYFVAFRELVDRGEDFFGREVVVREYTRDQLLEEPRAVVAESGGKAYLASDGDELLEVYEDIDKLERSEIGRVEYKTYHELYQWPLGFALVAAFLAFFLKETVLKSIP